MNEYLSALPAFKTPAVLRMNVMCALRDATLRRARVRMLTGSLLAAVSLAFLAPLSYVLGTAAASNGFFRYALLLVSDLDLVVSDLGSFLSLLVEATPLLSATAVLGALFLLLFALRVTALGIRARPYAFA